MSRSLRSLLFALALAGCAAAPPAPEPKPAQTQAPKPPEPPMSATEPTPGVRLGRDVVPTAYRLDYDAHPAKDRFTGHVEIDVKVAVPHQTLWLHQRDLDLTHAEVRQNGKVIAARALPPAADGLFALVLAEPLAAGQATVAFTFSGPFGRANEGFYKVEVEKIPYLFTQFEATSARRAFPCFDQPDFKAPMALTVTTDANVVTAANMPIASEKAVDGGKQVTFQTTPPLPTYLYAWTIGQFDVVDAPAIPASGPRTTPLPLRGLAIQGHGKLLGIALSEMAKYVPNEEAYFGIAFPWPKLDLVAVPDFEAGAMENVGLITFRSSVLEVDPARATLPRLKGLGVDEAHELAHQWFGDLVTTSFWDDIWLNESFASWMEDHTMAEVHPEMRIPLLQAESADGAMGADSLATARKIRQPITSLADIHDAFDGITYAKGEAVIAMFERFMGPEVFRKAIHDYLVAHANGNATSDDLLQVLSATAGKDVATPFRTFLDQPGVPLLNAELKCEKGKAALQLSQTRYLPLGSQGERNLRWQVPVCARYQPPKGEPAVACTLLTQPTGALELPGGCPKWVQPDADMDGYYRWTLPSKQLADVAHAKLSNLDRYAVMAAIRAGSNAGLIPPSAALPALEAFAGDANRELSSAYGDEAEFVLQDLADDSWRPAVRKRVQKVYAPLFAKLGLKFGPKDDDATVELRGHVANVMARTAEDPKVREALAKLGRAYLGLGGDGKLHPEAVPPELAGMSVYEALNADPKLVPPTLERFYATTDETSRGALFGGILGTHDPVAAQAVLKIALDPRTRANEVLDPLFFQASDYRTQPAAWAYVTQNFDAIFARLGDEFRGYIPFTSGNPCTAAGAKAIEDFYAPKIAADPGLKRGAAQLIESVRLCAARADAQREDAKKYFTKK
ncbi:MAG: M1 family metallopeptidase [Deltaproteobacteria bacterium]|nr:M1 family metallopeptidase [Deltaproteobacteria bacterium]